MKQVRLMLAVFGIVAPTLVQAAPLITFYFDNTPTPERLYRRHTECEIHDDKVIVVNGVGGVSVSKETKLGIAAEELNKLKDLIAKVASVPLEERDGLKQYYTSIVRAYHNGDAIVVRESRDNYLTGRRSIETSELHMFLEETCQMHGYVGKIAY